MDLFFESVDVTRSSPAPSNSEYQVRPAAEIFSDLEEEKRRSPITTETLARLLLKQGYADKARVIFEEILAGNPSRLDLLQQVTALRQQLGLPPYQPPPAPVQPPLKPQAPPASALGARVPPLTTLGARVPPPAQPPAPPPAKAPQPMIASPSTKPAPPAKAEKVEALKEVLERIKKGKQP
jgi:hypothetical protein